MIPTRGTWRWAMRWSYAGPEGLDGRAQATWWSYRPGLGPGPDPPLKWRLGGWGGCQGGVSLTTEPEEMVETASRTGSEVLFSTKSDTDQRSAQERDLN